MKTVYCIALEGNAATGVDWYDTRADREEAKGRSGAEREVYFTLDVPKGLSGDAITELVDTAAWEKTYTPEQS